MSQEKFDPLSHAQEIVLRCHLATLFMYSVPLDFESNRLALQLHCIVRHTSNSQNWTFKSFTSLPRVERGSSSNGMEYKVP